MHEVISQQPQIGVWAEIHEQLKFETLLSDLSGRFVNLPAEQIDGEIQHAQRKICKCLAIDHSALWQSSPDIPWMLLLTHLYRDPKLPPAPDRMDGDRIFRGRKRSSLGRRLSALKTLPTFRPKRPLTRSTGRSIVLNQFWRSHYG